MSYKTILVYLENAKNLDLRIELALEIAAREKAHLIGLAPTGASRFLSESAVYAVADPLVTINLTPLRDHAEDVKNRFEYIVRKAGIDSFEAHVTDDDAIGSIERHMLYCDLVILGQFDPTTSTAPMDANLSENIVLGGGGPALIVPHSGVKSDIENRILIAWNGRVEARRAVRDALPLLRRARMVDAVVYTPDAFGDAPGKNLEAYLARHDIKVNIINQGTNHDVGDSLLSLVSSLNSDLLVMGLYGHSRMRELVLGGVTRTILQSMTIPVFTSH